MLTRRVVIMLMMVQMATAYTMAQTMIDVFKIPAYTIPTRHEWASSVYSYPEFQDGKILVETGYSSDVALKLNYNIFTEKIEMITVNGDTISLQDTQGISGLKIGSNLLYNDPRRGYVEVLGDGPVYLGVMYKFNVVMENTSGEKFVITDMRETTSRYDRYYKKMATYYFMDSTYNFNPAVQASLNKMFPKQKSAINSFVDNQYISFKREGDLLQLLEFCNKNLK